MGQKIKVIDCFSYNGEKELLGLRLSILNPVVDEFWVIWGTHTFKGEMKDKVSRPKIEDFGKAKDKVRIIEVPNNTKIQSTWHREFYQKSFLGELNQVWRSKKENAFIFCSDVDEVWNPNKLMNFINNANKNIFGYYTYFIDNYHFKLNYKCISGPEQNISGPYVIRSGSFASLLSRMELRMIAQRNGHRKSENIDSQGWHWSYLSNNDDFISSKINSFSHAEPEVIAAINIELSDRISKNMGLLNPLVGEYWSVVNQEEIGFENFDKDYFNIEKYLLPTKSKSKLKLTKSYIFPAKKPLYFRTISLLKNILSYRKMKFKL